MFESLYKNFFIYFILFWLLFTSSNKKVLVNYNYPVLV